MHPRNCAHHKAFLCRVKLALGQKTPLISEQRRSPRRHSLLQHPRASFPVSRSRSEHGSPEFMQISVKWKRPSMYSEGTA